MAIATKTVPANNMADTYRPRRLTMAATVREPQWTAGLEAGRSGHG